MAKKRRYKKRAKQKSKLDLAVVSLIVFSILLAVLIYTKSGVIGLKLNEVLGGMFGIMQYVLPLGIFAVAIKLACSDGKEEIIGKMIQYLVAVISISIVFSVFQISSGELEETKELSALVKDAYYLGSQSKGGGVIGAVAAAPLAKLLGDIGAVIFCIGLAVILLVFIFGINLSEIINMIIDKMEEKREERLDRKAELAKEEAEETPAERRKRLREERQAQREMQKEARANAERQAEGEQIKINFGDSTCPWRKPEWCSCRA